jgi:hypothetical protein
MAPKGFDSRVSANLDNAEIPCRTGDFGGGQGRRRSVDLWFFRPIEDVAPRLTTGHGVPFHWVCELQRDIVKPREFAERHLEGTWKRNTDAGTDARAIPDPNGS